MTLVVAALIASVPDAAIVAAAGPAGTVTGIMVEPDGSGARVVVALDGPFHYLIDRRNDRVLIVLDPVSAAAADHTLTIGPVRSLRVRSIAGVPPRAEVTIFTSEPVQAADSSLDGHTLVVRLVAARRGPTTAVHLPAVPPAPPHDPAAPERIAGRVVAARIMTLDEGTGRLLDLERVIRVAVSDPRIVGVIPLSTREVLVTGRAAGRATVYVWEGSDRLVSYAVEVRAGEDPFGDLRRALAELLPGSAITVIAVRGARPRAHRLAFAPSASAGLCRGVSRLRPGRPRSGLERNR